MGHTTTLLGKTNKFSLGRPNTRHDFGEVVVIKEADDAIIQQVYGLRHGKVHVSYHMGPGGEVKTTFADINAIDQIDN